MDRDFVVDMIASLRGEGEAPVAVALTPEQATELADVLDAGLDALTFAAAGQHGTVDAVRAAVALSGQDTGLLELLATDTGRMVHFSLDGAVAEALVQLALERQLPLTAIEQLIDEALADYVTAHLTSTTVVTREQMAQLIEEQIRRLDRYSAAWQASFASNPGKAPPVPEAL